jgi:type II secretory pathway pseudopilin PulG
MTLIEVVASLAMFALIALALESALMLASKAIPDAKSASTAFLAASKAHDQIACELFYAQTVTELSANAITFTVADRDNDGAPETIRYAWSGTAGDPLVRTYNGKTSLNVLDDVREFSLLYDKRSVKQPTTYTEGPEQQVYSSGKGLLGGGTNVDPTNFVGESFPTPNFSGSVVLWRITRLRFTAQQCSSGSGGSGDSFRVQVRPQDSNGLPTGIVVDQAVVQESSLPNSFGSYDITFTGPATLLPSDGACIVFRYSKGQGGGAVTVWTNNLSLALLSGTELVSSSNAGSSWGGNTLRAVAMTVWAAPSSKDPDAYQFFLTNVRATMRSGSDTAARLTGTFAIPSQPQVAGP